MIGLSFPRSRYTIFLRFPCFTLLAPRQKGLSLAKTGAHLQTLVPAA
jgi:hypothetical protein